MPAPSGNQYAIGNHGGRPSLFDKKVEAEELIIWAQKEDSTVLRMFAPLRGYTYDTMCRWSEEDEEFRLAYHIAKDIVGSRREQILINNGSSAPFQRYATYYDRDLLKHEKDQARFESQLKQSENESSLNAVKNAMPDFPVVMAQIATAQSERAQTLKAKQPTDHSE